MENSTILRLDADIIDLEVALIDMNEAEFEAGKNNHGWRHSSLQSEIMSRLDVLRGYLLTQEPTTPAEATAVLRAVYMVHDLAKDTDEGDRQEVDNRLSAALKACVSCLIAPGAKLGVMQEFEPWTKRLRSAKLDAERIRAKFAKAA